MFNECRHILPSGARCKAPALTDQFFCYFHSRLHRAGSRHGRPRKSLRLPSLEDPQGIQIALTEILGALGSPSFDIKRAGVYLYGLQIATTLADRASAPQPADIVRSISNDASSGENLAPEAVQCEPGAECDSCPTSDECVLHRRVAYVSARHFYSQVLKELRDREQSETEADKKSLLAGLLEQWQNEPQWEHPSDEVHETTRDPA